MVLTHPMASPQLNKFQKKKKKKKCYIHSNDEDDIQLKFPCQTNYSQGSEASTLHMQEYHSVPCQCFPKRRFTFEIPSAWGGKWLRTGTGFLFVSFMKQEPGTQCLLKNGIDLIELYNPHSLYLWGEGQLCLHTSPRRKIKERKKFRFHKIKLSFFILMDYFILDMSGSMVKGANNSGVFFFSYSVQKTVPLYLRHGSSKLANHRPSCHCSSFPHPQNRHRNPCPEYLLGFRVCEHALCYKHSVQSYRWK